jgi:undecaprenyl-diphosphatase
VGQESGRKFMNIFQTIILGIIEGVTEFLPISSTFHLLFATKVLGLPESEFSKFFDVFIQAGAILPVIFLFGKEWFKDRVQLQKVAVSFIPTAIIGLVLHKVIKNVFFESPLLMLGVFIAVGLGFFLIEWLVQKKKLQLTRTIADLTYTQAVVIGIAQACAVVPGVSRAGAVILGMMLLGIKRDEAAKYSFTLAVPTILAAAALDVIKTNPAVVMDSANLVTLAVGFVVAFLSSLVIIKWFINYLRQHSLNIFGIYRVIVGAGLLLLGFGK